MASAKPSKAPERFVRLVKKAMAAHPDRPSLSEVARRADLSPAYLSLMLRGERRAPSNEAIAQLERVLLLPQGELNQAAGKPDDSALEFFRREEAAPIMRTLSKVPNSKLETVREMIEKFLQASRPKSK